MVDNSLPAWTLSQGSSNLKHFDVLFNVNASEKVLTVFERIRLTTHMKRNFQVRDLGNLHFSDGTEREHGKTWHLVEINLDFTPNI
jgi:hypothetical protein